MRTAVVAVGHTILVVAHSLLTCKGTYDELGPDLSELRDRAAVERRSVRRLEALDYRVTLESLTPAA